MAKDNKKLVQAITSQEENFAQWYTDICVKAELVEYCAKFSSWLVIACTSFFESFAIFAFSS